MGKGFIAASNRCTTKSLSKLLSTCLAKITCHFREYYHRVRSISYLRTLMGKGFIAASNRCTTKSLSKLLSTCLAKITCHFREYYHRVGRLYK